MRIGIMGGTYNPIHIGHLILSQFALENLALDKILFIPTGMPPHKTDVLDSKHRLKMVEMATSSNEKFEVSTIETDKPGLSYTYDTLLELKKDYKEDKLFFIIGADSLMDLKTWKNYDKIIKMAEIVVMDRLGYDDEKVDAKIEKLNKLYSGRISKVACPIIEVSSTKIRERIREEKTIKYLVPENVEKYILENKFYE